MLTRQQDDGDPLSTTAGRRTSRTRRLAAALAITGALAAGAPQAAAAADAPDSAACPNADATAQQVGVAKVRTATLCLLRAERDDRGLPAVKQDTRLTKAGAHQATAMVRQGYFGHVGPDGRTLSRRLGDVGWLPDAGRWWAGEILAEGTGQAGTAAGLVDSWLHSPAHKAILTDPTFDRIGVGVVSGTTEDASEPGTTSAVVFGKRVER